MNAFKLNTTVETPDHIESMIAAMDKQDDLVKTESGSYDDEDGHCVEYKYNGKTVFWTMIHSSQGHYILRSMPGLLTLEVAA